MAAAAVAGCVGYIGGDSGSSNGGSSTASTGSGSAADEDSGAATAEAAGTPTTFTCNPTQKPAVDSLRALTTAQYQATLSDLVSFALDDPSGGPTVMGEVTGALASLPGNVPVVPGSSPFTTVFPDGGWLRADQDQQFLRIEAFYNIGIAISKVMTNATNLEKVVGSCATDADATNDDACLTSFVQKFAPRVLRRAITAADVTQYRTVYGTPTTANPAAYADVIVALFNAPEVLYFVEHGDQPVAGLPGVYTLSSYELASRLSYHLWDTMPDAELWQTAVDGTLLQPAVYQKEVTRMFADARTEATIDRFFGDYVQSHNTGGPRGTGGLNYHDLTANSTTPAYQAFAGSDLPTEATYGNLLQDSVNFLDYYTWKKPGTLHDLLTSPLSFAQTADVAKLYGVARWDGKSTPPSFPDGQRPGLFTRALFLAAGSNTTPILKGVFVRRYVLCDTLGPPPAAAANATIAMSTKQTTRQVVESITSGSPCNGCHPTFINPLGFATENFDGLGRLRTNQTLFNADGTMAASLPVDTTSVPQVEMGDTTTTAAGASDLMSLIEKSNKFGACLTRNYFRYVFARFEDVTADGCSLEQMRSTLDNGGHLIDMLKSVVMTPAFKTRTFQ